MGSDPIVFFFFVEIETRSRYLRENYIFWLKMVEESP